MNRDRSLLFLTSAVPAVLITLASQASAEPLAETVFDRIAERLSLMERVAAWKLANDVAVEDLEREAVVLESATGAATDARLDAETARAFFAAQIEAAKDIQRCWIERWEAEAAQPPETVPDLTTEIRPRLLELGGELLHGIEAALAHGVAFDAALTDEFAASADIDCLSAPSRDAIYRALGGLHLVEERTVPHSGPSRRR